MKCTREYSLVEFENIFDGRFTPTGYVWECKHHLFIIPDKRGTRPLTKLLHVRVIKIRTPVIDNTSCVCELSD